MALAGGIYGGVASDPYQQLARAPVRAAGPPRPPDRGPVQPQPMMPPVVGGPPRPPDRGPVMPPPAPMYYENPTVRQQRLTSASDAQAIQLARSMGQHKGTQKYDATLAHQHEILKQKLAASAARYGAMRMAQLRSIQTQLPPEMQQALGMVPDVDPAAAWRAISGSFTQQAAAHGYQDPRLYLAWLLQNRGQQTVPITAAEPQPPYTGPN